MPCTVVAVRNTNSMINTMNVLWKMPLPLPPPLVTRPTPSILLKFHIMTPPEILSLILDVHSCFGSCSAHTHTHASAYIYRTMPRDYEELQFTRGQIVSIHRHTHTATPMNKWIEEPADGFFRFCFFSIFVPLISYAQIALNRNSIGLNWIEGCSHFMNPFFSWNFSKHKPFVGHRKLFNHFFCDLISLHHFILLRFVNYSAPICRPIRF